MLFGTVIRDPLTKYNGKFSIEWIIVGKDYPGAPEGSVTLLAKHVLSLRRSGNYRAPKRNSKPQDSTFENG